jgi:hypothetical protein
LTPCNNNFDLYTEDLHLDQLFQQAEPIMAQPNQQDFQQLHAVKDICQFRSMIINGI